MIKEARIEVAGMLSLMERMNKHYTKKDASIHSEKYINRALLEAYNGQKLFVLCKPQTGIDVQEKKKMIELRIGPLRPETIMLIKGTSPYKGDRMGCREIINGKEHYIVISKEVPWQTRKPRKASDDVQTNTQTSDNPFNVMATLGLNEASGFNPLAALQGMGINLAQDDNNANRLSDDGSSVDNQQGPSSFSTPDEKNAILDDWLNNYYLGIVKLIEKHHDFYDPSSLQNLQDLDLIKGSIASSEKMPVQTKIYAEQSDEEITQEIADALAKGNYASVISSKFNTLNLENAVWGNHLSQRNINMIIWQAQNIHGLSQSDPDYPTFVAGMNTWKQNFNRRLKPNARAYHMGANWNGSSQYGAEGDTARVQKFGKGFQSAPMVGFDVSDTEPIDPNDDWFTNRLGLKNNLTGEVNQMVTDALQKVQQEIPQELVDQATKVNTTAGKCKIYNKTIIDYNNENNLGASLAGIPDDADDSQALRIYIKNVSSIGVVIATKCGFANGSQSFKEVTDCVGFAIAHYTVGEEYFGKVGSSGGNLNNAWKTFAGQLVGFIRTLTSFIKKDVFDIFAPFRDKVNEVFANVLNPQEGDTPASDTSADNGTNPNLVAESKDIDLEEFLEEFKKYNE